VSRVIAVSNQKGGVGKTTTSINFAASLAAIGHKTLLIDLDPQRNASVGVSIKNKKEDVYSLLVGRSSFESVVYETFIPNLFIIPSSADLAATDMEFSFDSGRERVLKKAIESNLLSFDYTVIDCPPSLGFLSLNALVAADSVLVPLQCEYYALEGLVTLLDNIVRVRKKFNSSLVLEGIVLTMYDKRSSLSKQIEEDVRTNIKDKVFKTVIPRNVKIAEAPSHGKPIMFYDLKCSGSVAYMDLAIEFLKKGTRIKTVP
jgi:chromosome partitioning protein